MSLSKCASNLDLSSASSSAKKTNCDEKVFDLDRVRKAGLAISRGPDVKADMLAIASKSVQWGSFLKPAPLSIILLGQLNLIATTKDFSLNRNPPQRGYKWLNHPDSFRASLCQVSNSGFDAFNEAHNNMDQIKMLSGIVQSHIKTAMQTIIQGTPVQIERFLPVTLESIVDISDQCVTLASNIENKFGEVKDLIGELLEATCKAKGLYENDYSEVQIARQVTAIHTKETEDIKKQYQKEREEYKKQMVEAEEEYKTAIKSAPKPGQLFLTALGDVFINTVAFIPNILGHVAGAGQQQRGRGNKQATQSQNPETSELCRVLEPLSVLVEEVVILTTESKGRITDEELNEVKASKHHFDRAMRKINALKPNPYNGEAVKVVKNLLYLAEHIIQKHSNDFMQMADDGDNGKLVQLAKDARKQFKLLKVKLSAESEFSHHTMSGTLPQMSQQQASGSPSLMQAMQQDYRFKVEMQMQRLKDAKESYFKTNEKFEKQSKELAELLGTMAKLDLEKVKFEEICETLLKGMQALGEVKQHWAKLLSFFQGISNIVKVHMQIPLEMFVKQTKSVSSQLVSSESDRSLKDVLYKQAFTASTYAFIVEHIAGLYTDVSERFIMDDVAAMGTLIAYDPKKDKGKIRAKMEELRASCSRTQSQIDSLVTKKQKELAASIDKRLLQIETEFKEALPPPGEEEAEENAAIMAMTPDVEDNDDEAQNSQWM